MRYHYIPTRMTKTKKTDQVLVKIWRNTYIASGNVSWDNHFGKLSGTFKKVKHALIT